MREREKAIFAPVHDIPGVDLNRAGQVEVFEAMAQFYDDVVFSTGSLGGARFRFDNPNFSYGEAITLACLLRHVRPQRVIEIGSGHSSCALLDLNELYFSNQIDCSFIEPFPELLYTLLQPSDLDRITVMAQPVQTVGMDAFAGLNDGDILLVDSTHVCKTGSDVNVILFDLLPALKPGVWVHFHDVYYPFEYPREWVYAGRAWNEAYVLRAFLQYNRSFEIAFYNQYFAFAEMNRLRACMPLCAQHPGSSLWLRRTSHGLCG